MKWSKGLTFADIDHCKDANETMKKSGRNIGHSSSDGGSPWDRMDKYGVWGGTVGENLSFGAINGMNAVIQLYIDDGVPSKGHRANLTNPQFKIMGAAAGEFPSYGNIMTQNFAKTFKEKPENYPARRRILVDDKPAKINIGEEDIKPSGGDKDDAKPDLKSGKNIRRLFKRRSFN